MNDFFGILRPSRARPRQPSSSQPAAAGAHTSVLRVLPALAAAAVGLLTEVPPVTAQSAANLVSAYAAAVGRRQRDGSHQSATLYTVPPDRTFLLTDVVIAGAPSEVGHLELSDNYGVRLAVPVASQIVTGPQTFLLTGGTHQRYETGVSFGPGQSVIANAPVAVNGVNVTIMGRLIRTPGGGSRAVVIDGRRSGTGDVPEPARSP